jgi:flagellar hook-length control protein FliK
LALDSKAQSEFTFLQPHATPTPQPPAVPVQPHANSETKRDTLQGHVLDGSATSKQEKAGIQAASESSKKEFDGARDEASSFAKNNSPSSVAAPSDGHGVESFATAAGSVISMHASTPDTANQAGTLAKAATPMHAQSTASSEDAEATAQATVLGSGSLHTAKLVAGMERSELRMGLRTGEFGNVDIRTSLVRNQLTAEISAERGELGRALAAELPGLQHRLTEQHLPAANITVQDNSGGGTAESRQGSHQNQSASPVSDSSRRANEDSLAPMLPVEAMEPTNRLDIHM